MTWLRSFARFWYDFVIGDDWRVAVGVTAALGTTWGLAHAGVNAWWLVPASVAVLLARALHRAVRPPRRRTR